MKIWVEVNEQRLAANFHALTQALAATPSAFGLKSALLAVVKANAYGHGIAACVPTLARSGAEWLGVTDAHEGVAVREALLQAGIPGDRQPHILIMSGLEGSAAELKSETEAILTHHLTPVVWTHEHISALQSARQLIGHTRPVPVHLEIDTGMARQGVQPGPDLDAILNAIARSDSGITLDGVFTHFASAEVVHSRQTARQRSRFEAAVSQVRSARTQGSDLKPRWLHVGNSSYLDNGANNNGAAAASLPWLGQLAATLEARPMVRSGLALYGYLLPLESEESAGGNTSALPTPLVANSVRPVLAWKTRIIGLRDLAPGDTIGYNGIFIADSSMRVALLPVGYADGLRRELSASNDHRGGWVIIRGQRAPMVGRVSMNLTVVDVTAIPTAAIGDEALLLGDGITAQDHASLTHTIAYEILCNLKTSP